MLNTEDICTRLELAQDDPKRLSIVPKPDLDALRARGGTSVDLRLGRWFRSYKLSKSSEAKLWLEPKRVTEDSSTSGHEFLNEQEWAAPAQHAMRTSEHFIPFGDKFIVHPGRFVLGATMEWLTLPRTLSGYVSGKSSLGRHGLIIETAAGLHPGFSGCLTLELTNVGEMPVAISPGMEICQIFLHEVEHYQCENAGALSGQRKPTISLPKQDPTFDKLRGEHKSFDR